MFFNSFDYILIFITILIKPINFNESKKINPLKAQAPRNDGLFISQTMKFMLKRAKISLKSNKKRRLGTISLSYSAFLFSGLGDS